MRTLIGCLGVSAAAALRLAVATARADAAVARATTWCRSSGGKGASQQDGDSRRPGARPPLRLSVNLSPGAPVCPLPPLCRAR
jgi:hypothetical protein